MTDAQPAAAPGVDDLDVAWWAHEQPAPKE
jgi:hypothetical protein